MVKRSERGRESEIGDGRPKRDESIAFSTFQHSTLQHSTFQQFNNSTIQQLNNSTFNNSTIHPPFNLGIGFFMAI